MFITARNTRGKLLGTCAATAVLAGMILAVPPELGGFTSQSFAQGNSDTPANANNPANNDAADPEGPGNSSAGNNPSGTDGNQGNDNLVGNAGGPDDDIVDPIDPIDPIDPDETLTGSILSDEDEDKKLVCRIDGEEVEPVQVDEEWICPLEEHPLVR